MEGIIIVKRSFMVALFLLAASNALACNPAQGTGQWGYQGYGGIYSSYEEAQDSYKQQYGTTYKLPITVYNNAINKIGQLDATGAGPVMQQKRLILQKQLINNGMG